MTISRELQLVRKKHLHRCVFLGDEVMPISTAEKSMYSIFYFPKKLSYASFWD